MQSVGAAVHVHVEPRAKDVLVGDARHAPADFNLQHPPIPQSDVYELSSVGTSIAGLCVVPSAQSKYTAAAVVSHA